MAIKSSIHIKPCNTKSSEAHNRRGFLGVQPMSGVSKERVTLWSGCTGLKALAGFLGQRPKPLGRAHNYESEACSYSGL